MVIDRTPPARPIRIPIRIRVRRAAIAMAARALTALVGGYAAAAVLATLVARLLPIDRAEATGWGMVLAFLPYAGFGLWSFHERRLALVAAVVWGVAGAGGLALYLLGVRP